MNDYIKALFAVKEDGSVLPLIIEEAKTQDENLLFTYKKGSKVWTEEFYIYDFDSLWDCITENEYTFPKHDELSLHLKNKPSETVKELLTLNAISDVVVGFVISEYCSNEFCGCDDYTVKEIEVYKHTKKFEFLPTVQARKLIPEIKDFYSREKDFEYEENLEIRTLHIHGVPILNGSYYFEEDSCTRETTYGCKHGKIYMRTNNSPENLIFYPEEYYDGYEEDEEEWDNTYGHLRTYCSTINTLRYLDNNDAAKMIAKLEEHKKDLIAEKEKQLEEVENRIKYITSHVSKDK